MPTQSSKVPLIKSPEKSYSFVFLIHSPSNFCKPLIDFSHFQKSLEANFLSIFSPLHPLFSSLFPSMYLFFSLLIAFVFTFELPTTQQRIKRKDYLIRARIDTESERGREKETKRGWWKKKGERERVCNVTLVYILRETWIKREVSFDSLSFSRKLGQLFMNRTFVFKR